MKLLSALFLVLLLPICAQAEDLYHIRHLSEGELTQTYARLLLDACRHADRVWQDSATDPHAGYWGTGRSDQMNEGIRAISGMVLTCGALLKYSDNLDAPERHIRFRQATRAIHYAVSTHRTGTAKCTDGKPWGGSWQSAMWAATLSFGAWLQWEEIDPKLRMGVERVIASEADRFLDRRPPGERSGDTKAEENGWNMVCLAVAANLVPAHPHATAWHERAIEYMVNTLSVPQDAQEKRLVDGRPVSDWFAGANLHPDFTLENHNMFHPSYMACSSYFMTQAAMYYTYARRPIPQAATHHLLDTWGMFRTLVLPSAEVAYPQGMDWELHGLPCINLYASLAARHRDPLAARSEQNILQYMRAWQNMCHGDLAVPGSRLGFTRHAICAEQAAYAFLAHKIFGPPAAMLSSHKAAAKLQGVWQHPYVEFIAHRTDSKFASFSWKNRVMGLLVPIGPGHDANPFFTVPIPSGFVGSFELTPKGDTTAKPLDHVWAETPNGFETTGSLLLNGGRLKQTLRVTSVGRQTLIYQDRVIALTNLFLTRELGVPLGIESDQVSGGQRVVHYRNGTATFRWGSPRSPLSLPGPWANIDSRLGVVMVAGSDLSYHQAAGYDPHTGVCPDILYASWSHRPQHFNAGDLVAHRIILFFVEVSPSQTTSLSQSFLIEDKGSPPMLRLKFPEGGYARIPLL
ncbi:MAG TPA: hypothetical protein P5205_15475 [Candidatus Paceibacterota bacterium]|nr:hypothetical protein [Verrucomicrobiota bacterium]HSA11761.1 hypothetical protein [Candidatus Paceibacterota bacterium]